MFVIGKRIQNKARYVKKHISFIPWDKVCVSSENKEIKVVLIAY